MALIDTDVRRTFATGIAGFSHVVDSLSAIKYAKVTPIRDETGLIIDFKTEGDFPRYGNDDDRADDIAVWLLGKFLEKIKKRHTYRDSEPTTSILTITSNVVYGKATGSMPDGRKAASRSLRARTPATARRRTACWPPLTPPRSCRITGRWTAFPTRRRSTPARWATTMKSEQRTLCR